MEKKGLIIAVDFDGTCVTHEYPRVGRDIGAAPVLRALAEAGHKLVLWTMRSDNRPDGTNPLSDAVEWFRKNDIPLFGINCNPEQSTWTDSPKAYAHIYIDDAAIGIPLVRPGEPGQRPYVDWGKVVAMLHEETSVSIRHPVAMENRLLEAMAGVKNDGGELCCPDCASEDVHGKVRDYGHIATICCLSCGSHTSVSTENDDDIAELVLLWSL